MRKKLKFFHIIVGNSSSSIASWWYWRYRKIKLPYSYYLHVSRDCENQQWIKYTKSGLTYGERQIRESKGTAILQKPESSR